MGSFRAFTVVFTVLLFVSLCVKLGQNEVFKKYESGSPLGFTSDCPGSWKPAGVKPSHLKKMTISVLGPGDPINAKFTTYTYYGVGEVSKHPDIDFKNKKTFIFVPGYLDNVIFPTGRSLCYIYRELGYNVLMFDIINFTTEVLPIAVRRMRPVGKHMAEMVANLTSQGLDPKDLELGAVSLGGQTMSFLAKNYRAITGKNISTLIALDPTGPCFRNLGPDQRIDKSDADFVVGVTTNMDGYGLAVPYGHVTFYVNGGEFQPGDVWWFPCGLMCSHIRSFEIWVSALLNPGSFIGVQCDTVEQARHGDCYNKTPMVTNTLDRFTDKNKPGIYYLSTENRYPYYLGKRGLKDGNRILEFIEDVNKEDMIWV